MLQQVNGHNPGSDGQAREYLREDLQEFLGGEVLLYKLDDLTRVNPVTLETVLRCLQARYMADTFYTNAGCTLVALNPFKPVPQLYSPELMREYHAAPQPQKLKPHVFTVGEQTYRNVKSLIEPVNQSIVVSGESGAGKTWTSRCLMKFYAVVATSPASWESHKIAERIEQRILNSNPVMEAFGNACTLRNNNSSRFGKFIQLQLNRAQQMTGAAVQTYLLEKTRVACQASSERNFHIFYQICKGASEDERLQWHLPEGAAFSWLPNPERSLEEDCFEVTREAMLHLGIDTPTQNNIFKVLAGLLHLGNIQFAASEDEAQPCQPMDDAKYSVRTAASLLGLPEDVLLEMVQIRTIRAGRQQQVFRKPCARAECDTRRDCLAKLIYARLFDWLVSVINSSICADTDSWTTFIGLLDVYGFESFPDNSLEQLCINYANEKLQQHFVAHYLRAQQEEYAVEGLEWSFINYQDNQPCLDLIEGSPISICSLINEECRLNRPSSAAQLQTRIETALAGSPCLGHNKLSREPSFIVVHYAGPVRYHTAGLVEKNKDPIPPELTRLLQQSQDPLLMGLFPTNPKEKTQEEPPGQSRAPVLTVVSKFKASLEQLLQVLHSTTPHYIRCIKPNSQGQAQTFLQEEVLSQLEACGLVETIHISAAGFPIRVSHRNFVERYKLLRRLHPCTSSGPDSPYPAKGLPEWCPHSEEATLEPLIQDILHTLPVLTQAAAITGDSAEAMPAPMHCGRTKVFMTDSMLELLECGRARVLEQCARCIQGGWRRHRHREQERQWRAVMLIQAAIRSWLTRKHIQRLHAAATVIKRAWQKWRIRMACLAAKELDGVEEKHFSQAPCSLSTSPLQTRLLEAIIRLWPLGLVLANTAMGVGSFQRKLVVWACLQLPRGSPSSYTVQTAQDQAGVTSIRALPQGSIKFHCRKSPLRYADICPEPSPYSITGFNQILLERHRLIHVTSSAFTGLG
ncbi:unconventional myosin-XIX isoform X10 [Homo sapiens]|uniref:Unconventional myosin-XIX n=1 Tax=Homo sapiens TaxID=9606 RepID=MYO19_HUMAN|nr:unconventional myosin-XIX isoform 2 [Homo sapiens]XP_047292789.1 unconventional myosin-XIX isoform X10 [Homo sapiens]XP_047292790.1 unconventional myosin-XIX isoform X10 [Homo sapiens]XP_047292791.1 unconventional myosin-XIX isoform X10 [Homo sapiens]XP_054173362.1 unconventional myosin-XIX isoform X10 [Homo sapiens]XP_054173363.1 unconventional myosin-XIX isoform X10 [Homo sapiens]XP_054173364.1 unconventional myosin-XIX isoform X10 [Homo sapiens]XP_054185337.1 unconventional myosin-XIX |eukprot:NP_001157207.1 unconventional myosin-XIX isoform 2 [Homo sapiens]